MAFIFCYNFFRAFHEYENEFERSLCITKECSKEAVETGKTVPSSTQDETHDILHLRDAFFFHADDSSGLKRRIIRLPSILRYYCV